MKLVNFESGYYDELLLFCKRRWPKKSEDYLKYRLFEFPENIEDNNCNLLVLNDENKIIGCNLFFSTKAKINGKEEKVFWSHDTIIDPDYRKEGDAGMLLIATLMQSKNIFGFGLSDINYKIHKKIKANFFGEAHKYFMFSFWSWKIILYKLGLIKGIKSIKNYFPETLGVDNYSFKKISDVNQLNIPNNGYWNPNLYIDFVRDKHFLKKRFFENHKKYEFYKLMGSDVDECYFVVRVIEKRGLPVLELVDFRFNSNKADQYRIILKGFEKLINRNRIPIGMIKSNIPQGRIQLFPLIVKDSKPIYCVTYNRLKGNISFFVTFADSDAEPDFRS